MLLLTAEQPDAGQKAAQTGMPMRLRITDAALAAGRHYADVSYSAYLGNASRQLYRQAAA